MRIEPTRLFSPARLDLVVKYLYIKECICSERCSQFHEELYEKHIYHRTGGYEPDGSKISIRQYKKEFRKLVHSMSSSGYIGEPIPISEETGIPLDGAHRLACCLYLDIEPKIEQVNDKKGLTWGHKWFVKNGFSQSELNEIVKVYCEIIDHEIVTFLLCSSRIPAWDNIEECIDNGLYILMTRCFSLDEKELQLLLRDVHSHEWEIETVSSTVEAVNCNSKLQLVILVDSTTDNDSSLWEKTQQIRSEIKSRPHGIPQEIDHDNVILNYTDQPSHSKHVITTLLNENIKDVHLMDEHLSALDANQRQAHGWDLPAWKIKVLTLTPRWDLMVRKKVSRTKSRAFGWAGRNFPEPVKNFLKRFI